MGYDDDIVVERDWWKRASVISTIPRPIVREFLDLRRRFGMEIANLLLALYNRYGTAVARRFYRRVADKDDLLDVLSVVESYLDRFEPEARRTLANYVLSILYESGVELIHEISRGYGDRYPGLTERAVRLFQELFRRGQYFSPACVVAYVIRSVYNGNDSPACRREVAEEIGRLLAGSRSV